MKPRLIKTASDHEEALGRIDELIDLDPSPGSDEGVELELLATLVERYEDEHYPMGMPDPVEAIKFRMEQAGLKQADLVPYIGSKGKVSEVLSRKRPLSLNMIRKLHEGLGIPAEVLLREPGKEISKPAYSFREFPLSEMVKRGYLAGFKGSLAQAREYGEELLSDLFSVFGSEPPEPVHCRRSEKPINEHSLLAWQARALHEISGEKLAEFAPESVDEDFGAMLAKLSYSERGPKTAVEFLNKKGVHVVFLKHLPKTYLDGASFLAPDGNPVIGMTLRHDRLDNFWFTLLHELGHVHLHLHDRREAFFDDTDRPDNTEDPREAQANDFAAKALIPDSVWKSAKSSLLKRPTADKVKHFADSLNVHSAIVAGRIRWERRNYALLPELTRGSNLRKIFSPKP